MEPLAWKWVLFVWGYALAWFLLNDRVKLLAYRLLDRSTPGATPEARTRTESDAKIESKHSDKAGFRKSRQEFAVTFDET